MDNDCESMTRRSGIMSMECEGEDKFLTIQEVMAMTGLSRGVIYALMGEGRFPLSREAGDRRKRWLRSEVRAWMRSAPPATHLLKDGHTPWAEGDTS